MDQKNKLPSSVEKILIRLSDGEGSALDRIIGSVLVATNKTCRQFKDDMSSLSIKVSSLTNGTTTKPATVDLWTRIERRIDEEERAAIYLGNRSAISNPQAPTQSWLREVFSPALFGGMAVGVATAAVAFFAFKPAEMSSTISRGVNFAANRIVAEQPPVDLVSFSDSQRSGSRSRIDNREAFRNQRQVRLLRRMDTKVPFEVDWMKSDGKVSFVQDPQLGSTVIWVKRDDSSDAPKAIEREPRIVVPVVKSPR